jgi:hypothetical protein
MKNEPKDRSKAAGDLGRPVSSRKTEANRKNAQKSTGPRTEAGKAKAATNSFKHGFFAKRLFPIDGPAAKDEADYLDLAKGLHAYYKPQGPLESLLFDMITVDVLRRGRLIEYEQKRMTSTEHPFEANSLDRLQRALNSLDRKMPAEFKELERLQAARKDDAAERVSEELNASSSAGGALVESDGTNPSAADGSGEATRSSPDATVAKSSASHVPIPRNE